MVKIAPSILAADILRLGDDVKAMADMGCDFIHVDVMDGMFVPNLSFGPAVVKAISGITSLPRDVHLMVERPERYIKTFIDAGASLLTIHAEAAENPSEALCAIRALGAKAGVSLKPGTPIEAIAPLLPLADMVLVMTVEPGFGGQSFMPAMTDKVEALRKGGYKGYIEVDGGINGENAPIVMAKGADVLVMGTSLFAAKDPQGVMAEIRESYLRLHGRQAGL